MRIERLVLVYDADGGLLGELTYVLGKLRGTAHCALCDVTHGPIGEKRAWRACRSSLGVPVDQRHRDELTPEQARACAGVLPCVLASAGDRWLRLVDPARIEACRGEVEALRELIRERAREAGLALDPP
jgi:hypothetical protein